MAIKIAGRTVKQGDLLYHARAGVWGQVVRFDPTGPAVVRIKVSPSQETDIFVQNGGNVNGKRVMYWHQPITLDMPVSDVSKLQALVDFLCAELYGDSSNG